MSILSIVLFPITLLDKLLGTILGLLGFDLGDSNRFF